MERTVSFAQNGEDVVIARGFPGKSDFRRRLDARRFASRSTSGTPFPDANRSVLAELDRLIELEPPDASITL
jgi:hypothetical protein